MPALEKFLLLCFRPFAHQYIEAFPSSIHVIGDHGSGKPYIRLLTKPMWVAIPSSCEYSLKLSRVAQAFDYEGTRYGFFIWYG